MKQKHPESATQGFCDLTRGSPTRPPTQPGGPPEGARPNSPHGGQDPRRNAVGEAVDGIPPRQGMPTPAATLQCDLCYGHIKETIVSWEQHRCSAFCRQTPLDESRARREELEYFREAQECARAVPGRPTRDLRSGTR